MTDIDIDAIRKREQAADPAPWTAHPDGLVWSQLIGDPVSGSVLVENAEFIAAARTDVPALLAKVAELTAALRRAENGLALADSGRIALLAKVDELTAERDRWIAHHTNYRAEVDAQLTAANRRADGLANDLRSAVTANTAYANENARLRSQLAERDTEPAGSDHWVNLDGSCWSDCPACKPITAEATR